MFGMSSKEFWEEDPQLYWAYRTFYLKQKEVEQENLKYETWLKGSINYLATSLAIRKNFSKDQVTFPSYNEVFGQSESQNEKNNKPKTKKDIDKQILNEFNAWARY